MRTWPHTTRKIGTTFEMPQRLLSCRLTPELSRAESVGLVECLGRSCALDCGMMLSKPVEALVLERFFQESELRPEANVGITE